MEIFNKLTSHLQKHVWCVIGLAAIFLFWGVAFSVSWRGADIASWVSILFAVVVIVYMLIQGYQMRNLIEQGHQLMAKRADFAAEQAGIAAKKATSTEELMRQLFEEGPPTADGKPAPMTEQVATSSEITAFSFNPSSCRIITLFALYIAAKTCALGRKITLSIIVSLVWPPTRPDRPTIGQLEILASGILMGFECFLPAKSISWQRSDIQIINLPTGFESQISQELDKRAMETGTTPEYASFVKTRVSNIDKYFDSL